MYIKFHLVIYVLTTLCGFISADLPIHVMLTDLVGTWRFTISNEVEDRNIYCGSTSPNTIEGNLKLGDYHEYLRHHYGVLETIDLNLTLRNNGFTTEYEDRKDWFSLAVEDPKEHGKKIGTWTALYDQGFEIILNDSRKIFCYSNFKRLDGNRYQTDPNDTKIGWYSVTKSDVIHYGCVYGRRVEKRDGDFALVDLDLVNYTKYTNAYIRIITYKSIVSRPYVDNVPSAYSKNGYFCKCNSTLELKRPMPKEFSWRSYDTLPLINQEKCGTCYSLASIFVLQIRFIIAIESLLKKNKPSLEGSNDQSLIHLRSTLEILKNGSFDFRRTLDSFLNQGCNGGYPYLIGKMAKDFGLTFSIDGNLDLKQESTGDVFKLYAKDYGYVGGCYQCTSCSGDVLMMEEIYNHGPVVAAVDGIAIYNYEGGIIDPPDTKLEGHYGKCDVDGSFLSGWEYNSHAVAVVGWGEEEVNGKTLKYWLVRNSWGPNWYDGGYFKIVRGKNAFGIESELVYMDPDLDRMQLTMEKNIYRHGGGDF